MEMKQIIEMLKTGDKELVDEVFQVAYDRKKELYPEWVLLYCALPKKKLEQLEENQRQIEKLMKEMGYE